VLLPEQIYEYRVAKDIAGQNLEIISVGGLGVLTADTQVAEIGDPVSGSFIYSVPSDRVLILCAANAGSDSGFLTTANSIAALCMYMLGARWPGEVTLFCHQAPRTNNNTGLIVATGWTGQLWVPGPTGLRFWAIMDHKSGALDPDVTFGGHINGILIPRGSAT